ncbi:MAG TPA: DUF885 domain-containing protein [Caulobacterales bacterium]|nr:DUF885 domain-containing protein [Caulobacterales bacterium]
MKALMSAAVLALGLLALAGCGRRGPEPLNAFDGRVEDWTREILVDSPELATRAGASPELVGRYADRLDDRSPLAVETRRSAALRRLAEVREFADEELPPDAAITYAVLRAQFEAAAAGAVHEYGDFSQLGGIHPYALNPLDSAFVTLPDFLDRLHEVNTFADAEDYLARLRAVAVAIDQDIQHARQDAAAGVSPPGFIIDDTLRELDDIIGVRPEAQTYVTGFKRKLDSLVSRAGNANAQAQAAQRAQGLLAQAVAIVRDRVIPAHQRAAIYLRGIRAGAGEDAGVWRLPDGEAYYRDALRIETTTDLTPAQIHRIGLDRVRQLTNQLDVALRRLGMTEGPVGARLAQMTADPQYRYPDSEEGRAQLLNDIRARLARVTQQAPNWFGRLPRQRLDVRRVPPFAEASSSGAYYEPGSIDGRTPGVYFVNLRDLGEMTKIDLPTQDYHEGVPGHHFQIALAREHTELPLIRRLVAFNAFEEGWALYAETLADEEGLYENDPVGRVGYLRWQLWRAARPVVDTGIHAMHWSRQQAIDYLVQTTGDAPGVIQTEVDRYVVWPGQACSYEIGRRDIAQLRDFARNELGPDFDLKAFHDAVLSNGAVPLDVLDRIVRDWIPQQRRAAARDRH